MGCASSSTREPKLHVVSTVFNPAGSKKRTTLYEEYRKRMLKYKDVVLYTIEASFDGVFSVTEPTSPSRQNVHIRVNALHRLWLKENLINYVFTEVLQRDPTAYYFAWIDGDIEFESKNWVQRSIATLQVHPISQLWSAADFLGPEGQVLDTEQSFGKLWQTEESIEPKEYHESYPHPGFAWGITAEALREIGGRLPEGSLVGSGDTHFAYGLIDRIECSVPPQCEMYVSKGYWAELHGFARMVKRAKSRIHSSCSNAKIFPGYADNKIRHHWHGDWKDRMYVERYSCLQLPDGTLFDPSEHLIKVQGILQLNNPSFLRNVEKYFRNRCEDSNVVKTDHNSKHGTVPTFRQKAANQPIRSTGSKPVRPTFHQTGAIVKPAIFDPNDHNNYDVYDDCPSNGHHGSGHCPSLPAHDCADSGGIFGASHSAYC
ncbi:hypothetical protein DIPPA_10548 [Diplonema papillatum]|nr:hypothetical protein DIPPA_10548 [Diplonema papillatum]|eukprot:gene540-808_t